jgi:hypothetical protein
MGKDQHMYCLHAWQFLPAHLRLQLISSSILTIPTA